MNEKINLCQILKDCPKGWEFYSSVHGEVKFEEICDDENKYFTLFGIVNNKLLK